MRVNFPRGRNAARGRNLETSFLTSLEHLARTSLGRGRVQATRFARASLGRATFLRTGGRGGGRKRRARRLTCRNRRPCRTVPRFENSSRVRDGRGRVPCSAKREWDHARGFPARSSGVRDSQSLPAAVGAVLWGADEHFDEVVVQRVIELSLEAP